MAQQSLAQGGTQIKKPIVDRTKKNATKRNSPSIALNSMFQYTANIYTVLHLSKDRLQNASMKDNKYCYI